MNEHLLPPRDHIRWNQKTYLNSKKMKDYFDYKNTFSNNRKLEGLDKALLENGTMKTEYSVLGFKWFRTCERAAAPDIVRV